jgi:branched-subunit amino acid transport protein
MDEAALATLQAVIFSRAAERVLLVFVGALSVYLGYSLFRNMPSIPRGEGKLQLPGGVSIFLSRIGPGVFFALFGCAIIGYSVTRPVNLSVPAGIGQASVYAGFAQDGAPRRPGAIEVGGLQPEVAIARLNGFLANARPNMSTPEADELAEAVRAAKFAIMLSQWKPEWGDRDRFAKWAKENGDRDPPDDLVPGATIVYRTTL